MFEWLLNLLRVKKQIVVIPIPLQRTLLELHNNCRKSRGFPPLTLHNSLNQAAQGHADYMAEINTLTHFGKNKSMFNARIEAAGYNIWTGGENIAYGHDTPEQVMRAWIESPGHMKNILGLTYTDIGFGMAVGSGGKRYWVVNFGSTRRVGVPIYLSTGTLMHD